MYEECVNRRALPACMASLTCAWLTAGMVTACMAHGEHGSQLIYMVMRVGASAWGAIALGCRCIGVNAWGASMGCRHGVWQCANWVPPPWHGTEWLWHMVVAAVCSMAASVACNVVPHAHAECVAHGVLASCCLRDIGVLAAPQMFVKLVRRAGLMSGCAGLMSEGSECGQWWDPQVPLRQPIVQS